MKNQINLLHKEFKPEFKWVCSEHLILVISLSLILSALGYAGSLSYLNAQQAKVDRLSQLLVSQQTAIDDLTFALENRESDPRLQNQLDKIKQQTRTRAVLVNHIRDLSGFQQRSFSSLFDALSQSSNQNLWLTSFKVKSNHLNLTGGLAQPKALPMWINQLSDTEFFQGQEFNVASVSKEENTLAFMLTSTVSNTTNESEENIALQTRTNDHGGNR